MPRAMSLPAAELRASALHWLCEADAARKAAGVRAWAQEAATLAVDPTAVLAPAGLLPGRPARPRLVPPAQVPQRAVHTVQGRAALLHAIAHIEFNAINLALDAVWRFPGMPVAYYRDWMRVAGEEARHFQLLCAHLATLGCRYGDHPAHDGLWAMTERTATDPLARMALVPRTLEARGLDVSPAIQARLAQAGDHAAVAILEVILQEEIGHVAIGNRWYHWLCERDGRDPVAHERQLRTHYAAPWPRPPFNEAARLAAGFSAAELALLRQPR